MENTISKNELIQKLETMNKENLDKIDGFVMCLISQGKLTQKSPERRQPLLTIKIQNE